MIVKGRLREQYALATRGAVLNAATTAFVANGFDKTTIDDVADQARVSKGTVYYHFADKSALFEAAFRACQEALVQRSVQASLDAPGDTADQLMAGLLAYLEGALNDRRHRQLLLQAATALGSERCRQLDEELALPLIVGALQQANQSQQLAPGVRPDAAARFLFAGLCDAIMFAGAQPNPTEAADMVKATLNATCFGGLFARPDADHEG